MSNPYDPNAANNPYGAPDPSAGAGAYGQGGGGYGTPYGQAGPTDPYGNQAPKKTDPVSIIGFILSLTFCLSLIGFILGLVGLSRTKQGKRKGRWAAISATIIGLLATIIGGVLIAVLVIFANSVISIDEAKVGQCLDVSSETNDSVTITDQSCDGDHDGEITWVGTFDDLESSQFVPSNPDDLTDAGVSYALCTSLMDPADVDALGEDVEYQLVNADSSPTSGEAALCYATRQDGKPFTEKQLP
ncbi:DUF4190 domain-containing protein [Nocardioides rubriscoriae]|uniref:DUF4190 domain-containing protein n=1 Tax=Nocardioides rubriscoriae TaxID=642762 RepID=UPI0011E00F47|nr:DUF4190 domain-containing protein [Nocardioides rubriscoriae]